jgi:hypothetical protein
MTAVIEVAVMCAMELVFLIINIGVTSEKADKNVTE